MKSAEWDAVVHLLRAGHIDHIERLGPLELAERRHSFAEIARERRGRR